MIQSYIFHFGVWEPEISQIIENSLTTGDVFIDVGANIGYDSLLAAWRVGQLGKVVAIEASPTTFAMLEANLNLNEYAKNVRAVQIAASDRFEQLNLYNMPEHNIGASTTIASRAIGRGGLFFAKVQAKPLLEILHPEEIARVRLIKIDVEGAEPAIMSNILDSLHCFPANMEIIVETSPHDDYEASRNVFIRMKEAGFYAYVIENDYDRERYLSRALSLPVKTDELPDVQCDLFYTRRRLNCGP
ncbi:FkbM family methyltransferase [Roseiarcus fermentans]|nr:FkbM family methyltransferase [Roseiarcus fermentans]